jgi:hypothetical protein
MNESLEIESSNVLQDLRRLDVVMKLQVIQEISEEGDGLGFWEIIVSMNGEEGGWKGEEFTIFAP